MDWDWECHTLQRSGEAFKSCAVFVSSFEGSGKQEDKFELLLPSQENHNMLYKPGLFLQNMPLKHFREQKSETHTCFLYLL